MEFSFTMTTTCLCLHLLHLGCQCFTSESWWWSLGSDLWRRVRHCELRWNGIPHQLVSSFSIHKLVLLKMIGTQETVPVEVV